MKRALALLFLIGCRGEDVVLATVPVVDGGRPPEAEERCFQSDQCPQGKFCDKHDCADVTGHCRPFPTVCDEVRQPVCGCDGITYYNDCERRVAGIPSGAPGECEETALECDDPGDCPNGAKCARLVGSGMDRCGPAVRGRCWMIPATCPADFDRWDSCNGSPGALHCASTCDAIRSEQPAFRQTHCN